MRGEIELRIVGGLLVQIFITEIKKWRDGHSLMSNNKAA